MSDTWSSLSAAALGRGIEEGRIDPVDLTEHLLDRIEAHPQGREIYARPTPERARAEAAAARARAQAGTRRGPLDGVPISWKDLFDSAGTATEAGTALLAGRVPEQDAEVLARGSRAGLVCLGKTHMTELAFAGLGYNPITATPPNAHDPDLLPGGSSSGAAVSTALGLAAAGIGSDTGGSVRAPAAWNDLVGLKTSAGSLPLEGVVKLCPSFDTIGPLTRSVEDASLLWSVLSASDAPDLAGASVEGCRFAVLRGAFDGCDAPIAEGVERALACLAAAGALLTDIDVPEVWEAMDLSGPLFTAEAYAECGALIEAAPDVMFH